MWQPFYNMSIGLFFLSQRAIMLALRLPAPRKKVQAEMDKAKLGIEDKLVPKGANVTRHLALPAEGKSAEWILQEMVKMDEEMNNPGWKSGKLSGAVYRKYLFIYESNIEFSYILIDGGDELQKIIVSAFERYSVSNPLHPDIFPAIRKMDAEIVAMCLRLYNNPNGAGTTTSGGTESIVMAVKTYRDWAKAVKGITEPEMCVFSLPILF